MNMQKDDSGQFLLLSGIIISIGMVILLLFINQSSMAGRSSADSILSFPKNDIREVRSETIAEVKALCASENHHEDDDGQQRMDGFNASFSQYKSELSEYMAERGDVVITNSLPALEGEKIGNVTVSIYYSNGETIYSESLLVSID